jgi:hypothetical protein
MGAVVSKLLLWPSQHITAVVDLIRCLLRVNAANAVLLDPSTTTTSVSYMFFISLPSIVTCYQTITHDHA